MAKKKAVGKVRRILSAAAVLGGKMSKTTIRLAINNADGRRLHWDDLHRQPEETGQRILDTGSSTLAVDGKVYDPTKDKTATITDLAQEVGYADGSSWVGAVVTTEIKAGAATLPKTNAAIAYHSSGNMFGKSSGILGLAYTKLNNAFTMPGPTIPPKYTYNQIQSGKVTYVEPYFTQLESAGLVANKFAFSHGGRW